MFDFHRDRYEYFKTQVINAEEYLVPFVERYFGSFSTATHVLEIGSAEGGVLKAFVDKGCIGTGVELNDVRIAQSNEFLKEDILNGKVTLYHRNIFESDIGQAFAGKFDIIILKDVIEHINDQDLLLNQMRRYLRDNGVIFFGFPPWRMPFGGHQQICRSKFLSRLPWFHLLPGPCYSMILKMFCEHVPTFMEIKATGISIHRFERLVKNNGYLVKGCKHYLINPIYRFKFKLEPVEQFRFISKIPYVKDFFTTCVYYVITKAV